MNTVQLWNITTRLTSQGFQSLVSIFSFGIIGFQKARQESMLIAMQMITYALIIIVFAGVYTITPFEELSHVQWFNANTMIWYLTITELVIFAGSNMNFHDTHNDILTGYFSSSLQRPKSYFHIKLSMWFGSLLFRLIVFLSFAIAIATVFTQSFPYTSYQFLLLCLSIYLSLLMYCTITVLMAFVEVWGPYAKPTMWVGHKISFLLGGLILPISFYPEVIQIISWLTPYPALFYIPGKIAFNPSVIDMLYGIGIQILWLIALIGFGFYIEAKAYNTILQRGY